MLEQDMTKPPRQPPEPPNAPENTPPKKAESSGCLSDGCTRPVIARGLCATHYRRLRRLETDDRKNPRQDLLDPVNERMGQAERTTTNLPQFRASAAVSVFIYRAAAQAGVTEYKWLIDVLEAWAKDTYGGAHTPVTFETRLSINKDYESQYGDEMFPGEGPTTSVATPKVMPAAATMIRRAAAVRNVNVTALCRAIVEEHLQLPLRKLKK